MLIFPLLLIFGFTQSLATLKDLTSTNFDDFIESNEKVFVFFYSMSCPYCKHAINFLNTTDLQSFDDSPIGIINCQEENEPCIRFDINRVPFFIRIVGKTFWEYNNHFTDEHFSVFLNDNQLSESSRPLPKPLDTLSWVKIYFQAFSRDIGKSVQAFFKEYLRDFGEPDEETAVFIGFGIFFGVIVLEIVILIALHKLCERYCNSNEKDGEKETETEQEVEQEKEKTE